MSYNPNTQTINAPVSVYDVQQALATSEKDVGRLCVHTSINMWARYKPVKIAHPATIYTPARRIVGYGLESIVANGQSFGTFFNAVKNMIVSTGNLGYKWGVKYNKPEGGTASPYRLDDFANDDNRLLGYRTDATLYFSPIDGNYSIPLSFRPLLDGYTEDRQMEVVTVTSGSDPIDIPATETDKQQEINAWSAFNPERSISGDTGTQKQLSVSIFDILCHSNSEKVNFFNNNEMQMNRGFFITDGSSLLKWSVGYIPFADWLGMEGGLTGEWYFAEFYTNVNEGNYNSNTTQTGNFYLIPAAYGKIKIVTGSTTAEFINVETGTIIPSTGNLEISFMLSSPIADLINNYTRIRIFCDCNNTAQTDGATFLNNQIVNVSYFQNSRVWEKTDIPNARQYEGYEIHLTVYGDRIGGGSEKLLGYDGIIG